MDGILNIFKEPGYTSHDVVAKLRGILKQKKIGHTGTLDPDAAGVLPVCLGNATKVCELLTDEKKEYEAVLRLGITTDTYDLSGTVTSENAAAAEALSEKEVFSAIQKFTGKIKQIPPMYSAIKQNGKRLYELARAGIEVERKEREVTIDAIEVLSVENPRYRIRIVCSKGTYIRSLCHDIGEALGCGGCMESLLRTRVGRFTVNDAVKLSEVEAHAKELTFNAETMLEELKLGKAAVKTDALFEDLSALHIAPNGEKALRNGNQLKRAELSETASEETKLRARKRYRIYDTNGDFCGIYEYHSGWDVLKPVKLFL